MQFGRNACPETFRILCRSFANCIVGFKAVNVSVFGEFRTGREDPLFIEQGLDVAFGHIVLLATKVIRGR